jgi:hypothetical protein
MSNSGASLLEKRMAKTHRISKIKKYGDDEWAVNLSSWPG